MKAPNGDAVITDGNVETTYANAGWAINNNVITVPAGATTGKYTVTYTASDKDVNANNPTTYTENFFVGTACSVNTNLAVVATNAVETNTYLQILTVTDGQPEVQPSSTNNLEIIYPNNLDPTEKAKVTVALKDGKAVVQVAQDAKAGKYELVYKVKNVLPEDVEVKKVFEVKDYGLSLSKNAVELGASPVDVVASTTYNGSNYTIVCDKTTGVTPSGKTFSIDNSAAEGEYTITLTVDATDATSKATYKKTFTVKNTYEVNLSKGTIRRDFERDETEESGSDFITITTKKNGVATAADETSKLKIYAANDSEVTSNFVITYSSNNEYKLQVKGKTVRTPNGTYTLKYTGDNNTTVVKTTFIVQD